MNWLDRRIQVEVSRQVDNAFEEARIFFFSGENPPPLNGRFEAVMHRVIGSKIDDVIGRALGELDARIDEFNGEEILDQIIDRINRKQLRD